MEPTPAQETPKESRTEIPVNGLFIVILIIVLIIYGGMCFIAGYQFGKPATAVQQLFTTDARWDA